MKTILHSRIYEAATGGNIPIIILHGLLGTGDNWASISRRYACAGFTTHAIDLPCHGRSPHIEEINIDSFARCAEEYMEYHHIEKAIVIGHSLGGKVAMSLAMDSTRVEKLIVVDIAPVTYGLSTYHSQIFTALDKCCSSPITSREEAAARLSSTGIGDIDTAFLMKSLYRTDAGLYDFRFDFKGLHKNIHHLLQGIDGDKKYTGNTLFIKGGLSGYITDNHCDIIRKHFPHHTIHTIDKASHWVHVDASDDFYTKTIQWIKE